MDSSMRRAFSILTAARLARSVRRRRSSSRELLEERGPVAVDQADDVLVVPERHAHGRVDLGLDDAHLGPQALVGLDVGDEDGRVALQGRLDDRLADEDALGPQGAVLDPDDLGLEGLGLLVLEHEDAPVHRQVLDEHVHDVVEELVEGHVVDEGLADLAHDGDDLLVLLEALEVEPAARGLQGRAGRPRLLEDVLDLDDGVRAVGEGRPLDGLDGGLEVLVEVEAGRADEDLVAAGEIDLAADAAAVDERAVLAALVDQGVAPLGRDDDGVAARAELVGEDDVVRGRPADRHPARRPAGRSRARRSWGRCTGWPWRRPLSSILSRHGPVISTSAPFVRRRPARSAGRSSRAGRGGP